MFGDVVPHLLNMPKLRVLKNEVLFIASNRIYSYDCAAHELHVKEQGGERYEIFYYSLFTDNDDTFLVRIVEGSEYSVVIVRRDRRWKIPVTSDERSAFLLGDVLAVQDARNKNLRLIHLETGEIIKSYANEFLLDHCTIAENLVYVSHSLPLRFDRTQLFSYVSFDPEKGRFLIRHFEEDQLGNTFFRLYALGPDKVVLADPSEDGSVPLWIYGITTE